MAWDARAIVRFALVAILRVVMTAVVYAFVGFFAAAISLIASGLFHPISFIGFGLMSAAAAILAGAAVGVGSVFIPSFPILVALSLGAAIAPAAYFFQAGQVSLALPLLISGLLVGLFGAIAAGRAGLLAPDRRLGHDLSQAPP